MNKSELIDYYRGDKKVNYGVVMEVVGSINVAGYNHISLVTEMEEKK